MSLAHKITKALGLHIIRLVLTVVPSDETMITASAS